MTVGIGIWTGLPLVSSYCSLLSRRFNVGTVDSESSEGAAKDRTGDWGISSGIGVRTPSFGMVTNGEDMLRKLKIQL